MDLPHMPPLNVNKFQASVDIIRYCEWPKIKKYMNKRIVKAVNECKTQATIAKKFVGQIEKKKWSKFKKRSSSKGELEEKYDFDEDDISWGSDFDEDELEEDDVVTSEFIDEKENLTTNHLQNKLEENCRSGHYDLSQINEKLTNGEQLLNVGRFERIVTPTNSLMIDNEIMINSNHHHYALQHSTNHSIITNSSGVTNGLVDTNLDINIDGNSDVSTSISSSGVSSVCGVGSNDGVSPVSSASSYASACCSSSCNSSAADSTCSQSPPPLSTGSSTTSNSAKLACKLLSKLLTNSNGKLDNEHLTAKNLQLKLQLNEQLNKQFLKQQLNEQNSKFNSNQLNGHEDYSSNLNNKSNSINLINHNNNYLKNLDAYKTDLKSNLINKSMINLSQYSQLNDYHFKINENLNDEIIAVKTNCCQQNQKYRLNNSTSNLSTFKSTSTRTNPTNKSSFVAKQIEQLEQLNLESNNDDCLSSGSSSILSTFKFSGSDKSYQTAKESSSSCSSSIRSISLKQLSIKPTVPPKPNISVMKEDKSYRKNKLSTKVIRPSIEPPLPPTNNIRKDETLKESNVNQTKSTNILNCTQNLQKELINNLTKDQQTKDLTSESSKLKKDKSPYSSSHSLNDLISEFTVEEVNEIFSSVNEILNFKIRDEEDNEFLNRSNYDRKLIDQQQFSQTKSLQHLNNLEKDEQLKTTENGLKLKTESGNTKQNKDLKKELSKELNKELTKVFNKELTKELINRNKQELNEKLQLTKYDLINNLNSKFNIDGDKEEKISSISLANEQAEKNSNGLKEANFKSRFDHKFVNIDSKLDAECLNENAILNLRKTGNQRATKLSSQLKDPELAKSSNLIKIMEDDLDDYEKPICNEFNSKIEDDLKNNVNDYYLKNSELIENNTISPPPEFNDDEQNANLNNLIDLNQTNDELKIEQLKRQINLDKHLQSRWSSVDLVQQHQSHANRLNNHYQIEHASTPLPPPVSFSSSSAKLTNQASSMLDLPNRPKLPTKNKLDFLNSNSKLTSAKKIPNKLKSLPEIFTSKISSSNQKLSATTKLIDDKSSNTFTSTSLINQIKTKQTNKTIQFYVPKSTHHSIVNRPLPDLPLEHYIWYHNIDRDEASNLLIKFGKEGGFLVRTSKRAGNNSPYSLSIMHDTKIFNLNIRKRVDGLFALGKEKDKEKTFQSIPQLIEYHQTEAILLTTKGQNAGSTKLIATPNKF